MVDQQTVGRALVVEDPYSDVVEALERAGTEVHRWDRRLHPSSSGTRAVPQPWAPGGPFDLVAVRLPRSKDELTMTLHAVAGAMTSDGHVLLFGANDEGIKSVQNRLAALFDGVRSVATGGHCRVLRARWPGANTIARGTLGDWRTTFDPGVPALGSAWTSYPGVFSHGTLDPGSELLIRALRPNLTDVRVLDYGAGTGLLGGVCAARGATVDLIDVDTVALAAATTNVPSATGILGSDLGAVAGKRYDLIVSNPPIHRGKAEVHDILDQLVRGAPDRLERRGSLMLVVQRRLNVEPSFEASFSKVARVADDPVFKVLEGRVR